MALQKQKGKSRALRREKKLERWLEMMSIHSGRLTKELRSQNRKKELLRRFPKRAQIKHWKEILEKEFGLVDSADVPEEKDTR